MKGTWRWDLVLYNKFLVWQIIKPLLSHEKWIKLLGLVWAALQKSGLRAPKLASVGQNPAFFKKFRSKFETRCAFSFILGIQNQDPYILGHVRLARWPRAHQVYNEIILDIKYVFSKNEWMTAFQGWILLLGLFLMIGTVVKGQLDRVCV